MRQTRVVLADDNELAREAIRDLLAMEPAFEVVAEAVDGYDVLEQVERHEPDLVLMDLNMPRCDGLLATRLIKRDLPHVAVVMLSVSNDVSDLFAAIQSGAQGYLVKDLNPDDWLAYLRNLAEENRHVPPDMARRLLAQFQPATGAQASGAPTTGTTDGAAATDATETLLTDRQREVLGLVAQAYTDRQMAERLHISLFTVKNHIRNIRAKLGAANRVELALRARNHQVAEWQPFEK